MRLPLQHFSQDREFDWRRENAQREIRRVLTCQARVHGGYTIGPRDKKRQEGKCRVVTAMLR
jgi:hypothetical protein